MVNPVIKFGRVRVEYLIESGTNGLLVKHLRVVYTDAIARDGSVANEEALGIVVETLGKQSKDDTVDGHSLEPLPKDFQV
jgi:hypothetical protein